MLSHPPSPADRILRAVYREFLLETGLYLEVGLDDLPRKLGAKLHCGEQEAIPRLLDSPNLELLDTDELKMLLQIRDMSYSRTAAAVAGDLQGPGVTYERCIRTALAYAVLGRLGQVFSALRAAAERDDTHARHHHLYGLMLAMQGNGERARWELGMALEYEPFDSGKTRIRYDRALV